MSEISFPRPIAYRQNGRRCWVTSATIKQAAGLTLPPQGGQQISLFDVPNRGIDAPHADVIAKYLQTPHWSLPALILAVLPGVLPETTRGAMACDTAALRVLDGQHRIKAMSGLVSAGNKDLEDQELAVVIIEVRDIQDQGQIWQDFARNKPITGAWRDAVDNSAPFIRAAKLAADNSVVLKARVRVGRRALRHDDPELITLGGLKQLAGTIALGIQRTATTRNQTPYESDARQKDLAERLQGFFDRFLPMCRLNYDLIAETEGFGATIRSHRYDSCAYDTPALNLFANVWARWLEAGRDESALAQCIGRLNLNKSAPQNWLSKQGCYDPERMAYSAPNERKLWADASIALSQYAGGGG